jgi:hypothetical protein
MRTPEKCTSYREHLVDPSELLETLATRQEYQRPNEQTHIDDDRRAHNRPTHHPAGMQVVPDVQESRRGER